MGEEKMQFLLPITLGGSGVRLSLLPHAVITQSRGSGVMGRTTWIST